MSVETYSLAEIHRPSTGPGRYGSNSPLPGEGGGRMLNAPGWDGDGDGGDGDARTPGTYRVFLDDTGIDTDGVIFCSDVNQLQGVVVVVAAAGTPAPAPAAPVVCFA